MSQIKEEFKTIMERKNCGEEGSDTNYLINKGIEKIVEKKVLIQIIFSIKEQKK